MFSLNSLEVSIVGFLLLFDVIGLCSLELALESSNMYTDLFIYYFYRGIWEILMVSVDKLTYERVIWKFCE